MGRCGIPARGGDKVLIHVKRNDNHYDYVKDFMLDLLIDAKKVVKFKAGKTLSNAVARSRT